MKKEEILKEIELLKEALRTNAISPSDYCDYYYYLSQKLKKIN